MYTSLQYNISKISCISTILLLSSLLLVTTSLLNYTINTTTTTQFFHYTTTNTKCSLAESTRFCIHKLNIYNQLSTNITSEFFNNFHYIYNWTKHNLNSIQSLEYCTLETWKNQYDCNYSVFKETSLPLLDINYNHTQLDFTKIISKCFQHLTQPYIFSNCLYIQINYPSTNYSKYKPLISN